MSERANPTVIGSFVLGALALVVMALILLGSGTLMRERVLMTTFFPGTVQGLNLGAEVQFQGVPIGQVTAIDLDYIGGNDSFRIPVRYEIWPQRVRVLGEPDDADPRRLLRRMVSEKGLRARLESISFITGQYVVVLGLYPDHRVYEDLPESGNVVYVPAVAATRDRVEEMLSSLQIDELVDGTNAAVRALRELLEAGDTQNSLANLEQILSETRTLVSGLKTGLPPLLERADQTLLAYGRLAVGVEARVDGLADQLEQTGDDVGRLARNLDGELARVSAAATANLDEAGNAMRAITELAGQGSSTRIELERLLGEATRAARSLRSLADYLERHPEALLQGKR
jgi:paraquat-inducible protein B